MNTTEQRRAKKGGEMGINGLPYAGGTFLPNTQLGKMTKARKGGSGKVEVAPYVWEVAPEGKLPIFSRIRAFAKMIGGKMEIYVSNESLAFYGWTREEMQEQVDRFNAGERWR